MTPELLRAIEESVAVHRQAARLLADFPLPDTLALAVQAKRVADTLQRELEKLEAATVNA